MVLTLLASEKDRRVKVWKERKWTPSSPPNHLKGQEVETESSSSDSQRFTARHSPLIDCLGFPEAHYSLVLLAECSVLLLRPPRILALYLEFRFGKRSWRHSCFSLCFFSWVFLYFGDSIAYTPFNPIPSKSCGLPIDKDMKPVLGPYPSQLLIFSFSLFTVFQSMIRAKDAGLSLLMTHRAGLMIWAAKTELTLVMC